MFFKIAVNISIFSVLLTIELNKLISLIGFKIFKESQLFEFSPDRGDILVSRWLSGGEIKPKAGNHI